MQQTLKARLESLVGLWDTVTTTWMTPGARALESDGSIEKSWVLGGRFLREDLAGVGADGEPLMGLGFMGFDPDRGVYQGVWMSSGTYGMITHEGRIDDAGRIVFEGIEPAPGGGQRRFRATLTIESDQRHVLSQAFADDAGDYQPAFEIRYTRVEE